MGKRARSRSAREWALFILPALRRAKDLIDREYAQPLDLDDIASAAGYSKYHFSRSFGLAFGESPAAYLTRRRVERAKNLLRGANLNVTEVCFMVGFESVGSFSSLFRRLVGQTPSSYRAEALKSDGSPAVPGCVVMMWTRPRPQPNSKPREA